jgi:hippurate hydrolase
MGHSVYDWRVARLPLAVVALLLVAVPMRAQSTHTDVAAMVRTLEPLYRDLHQHPELGFQETRTATALADRLKALGYEVTTGVGRTGVVAVLKNGSGQTAMLRTELDALPVAEKTGVAFASTVTARNAAGQMLPVMHACGHDLHMTAWIGTATWMAMHRDRWHGTLMLVGQPAEETGGGATEMLRDGLFTRFAKPDFVIGLHDDDTLASGTIGYHAGYFRAQSISPTITLYGRGGHGAMPYNTVDPVVMASRTVLALQTIVSRENNPMDPVVVTIGSIHGGTAGNVIPDEVTLELSVRTFTDDVQKRVLTAIERIANAEAVAAGAPRKPEITVPASSLNAVYNDPALTTRLATALKTALGADRVVEMPAKMTSEDFSEYGRAGVPAVLLHVGAVSAEKLAEAKRTGIPVPAPHSPEWLPDLQPTLTGAIEGEVAALLTLLNR